MLNCNQQNDKVLLFTSPDNYIMKQTEKYNKSLISATRKIP